MTCLGLFILVNSCHWYPSTHVLICCWPIDLSSWLCRRTSLRVCYRRLLCRSILKSVMVAVIVIGIVVVVLGFVGLVWWLVECWRLKWWLNNFIVDLLREQVTWLETRKQPVNNPWKLWKPLTRTRRTPTRKTWGRGSTGTGMGWPGIPQGYPWYSLDATQFKSLVCKYWGNKSCCFS